MGNRKPKYRYTPLYDKIGVVYKVTFPHGKIYIGITSYNLNYRKREHFYKVRRGSKNTFQCALRKYWKHNVWEVIYTSSDYEELKRKEVEFVALFKSSDKRFGYNRTAGGDGTAGIKITDEHREKLRISHIGYKMPQSQKDAISNGNKGILKGGKPIIGCHIENGEVIEFLSIVVAEKSNFDRKAIWRCCEGIRKTHHKYKWKWKE